MGQRVKNVHQHLDSYGQRQLLNLQFLFNNSRGAGMIQQVQSIGLGHLPVSAVLEDEREVSLGE